MRNKGKNRRQLRGFVLDSGCYCARTLREFNGDNVCGGLHRDENSFFLDEDDVIERCRQCGAWHVNWTNSGRHKSNDQR